MRDSISAIALACALFAAASPAAARSEIRYVPRHAHVETEHVSKEPFGTIPKGPLQIMISIDQQELHLYSDGTHVADTPVATGVPGHATPMGVFSIIEKDRYHHSNIYSGAPMPFMERITWSGVALHEGANLGHPASHGCIRMSHEFAMRLWELTKLGVRVIIARPELRPQEFADPHLFAHKEPPATPVPQPAPVAPPSVKLLKTAETVDAGNSTDASRDVEKDAADTAPGRDVADPPASAAAVAPQPDEAGPATTPASRPNKPAAAIAAAEAVGVPPLAAPDALPLPPSKPLDIARASKDPITIFISRKDKKLYVRQAFAPLFSAPISVEFPEQPLGTHVITAMEYLQDRSSFRWNVVSLPEQLTKAVQRPDNEKRFGKYARVKPQDEGFAKPLFDPPPQTPQQALARIEISQDAIDRISQLIVPGSSLIIADQGIGEETGVGTDFIVVMREGGGAEVNESRYVRRPRRRADDLGRVYQVQAPRWQQPWQQQWQ